MNPHRSSRRRAQERASVLVVCLVLAALGTIGVAAWMALVDARGHQIEASLSSVNRRVVRANSRALAHRAIYQNLLAASEPPPGDIVVELPDGKGRAVIRAFASAPLRTDTAGAPSRSGGTPLSSQSVDVAVDIGVPSDAARWTYRLRNQHPALGGDLLQFHSLISPSDPTPLVSGNIRVKGRAVFWDAIPRDLSSGLLADDFLVPESIAGSTTFLNSAGVAIQPLNYPHYLRTTGFYAGAPSYRGDLEIISDSANVQNSYVERLAGAPRISAASPATESAGPPTKPDKDGDADLLAYVSANSPGSVASALAAQTDLSSSVLLAAVGKSNPRLSNEQLHQIFNAQVSLPQDAFTAMMANLDEPNLSQATDLAITELNDKNGARYNTNGSGMAQIFVERPGNTALIFEGVTRLRLFGQPNATRAAAAATLPPLVVLVDNRGGATIGSIEFYHNNSRPLILAIASASGSHTVAPVVYKGSSAFPEWRLILDLQKTGLAFDLGGVAGAKIVGGIRAHHRISATGGQLTLERETNGATLAPLLSRDAWIECIRN
jgi:hypothetical protein